MGLAQYLIRQVSYNSEEGFQAASGHEEIVVQSKQPPGSARRKEISQLQRVCLGQARPSPAQYKLYHCPNRFPSILLMLSSAEPLFGVGLRTFDGHIVQVDSVLRKCGGNKGVNSRRKENRSKVPAGFRI